MIALLIPSEELPDHSNRIDRVPVLSGSSEDLSPVVFITGGASTVSSPYPALVHSIDLSPGNCQQFIWSQ